MINLLYHIERSMRIGKKLDVLDYMWQEMHHVVLSKKVPIYGQYIQKLINTKLDQEIQITYYEFVKPSLHVLGSYEVEEDEDGEDNIAPLAPSRSKRARRTSSDNAGTSQVDPQVEAQADPQVEVPVEPQVQAPKKKHLIKSIFQKMNCFMIDKQDKDYKLYTKQKQYNRNQREIMKKLELPFPDSSEEVSENTYKSKNTYWLGDDASSLGPYWPGNVGASSSGQAHDDDAASRDDGFGHNGSFE